MKILICDDDAAKAAAVHQLVASVASDAEVATATSVVDAVRALTSVVYDLVILDIALPQRSGETPARDGGKRVLDHVLDDDNRIAPEHIVALTAHADLREAFDDRFASLFIHIIHYQAGSEAWRDALSTKIAQMHDARTRADASYDYDLAIVTALHEVELEAVLAMGDWREESRGGDELTCFASRITNTSGQSRRIIACAAPQMGSAAAALVTTSLLTQFRPRYVVMTGIAAGTSDGLRFGDILIAESAYDYGSGKYKWSRATGTIFLPAPSSIPIDAGVLGQLRRYQATRASELLRIREDWEQFRLRSGWNQSAPEGPPKLKFGPVASGAAVVQAGEIVEAIKSHNRKVTGVEMEVYGMFLACHMTMAPRPRFFACKAVCDFADHRKNDDYQRYAAYTSASFAMSFAREFL